MEIAPAVEQLRLPAETGGPHLRARRHFLKGPVFQRNEGVSRVLPVRHGSQCKIRRQIGRHVLQAVHGHVRFSLADKVFQLLDEQPLAPDLCQRHIEDLVAPGGDRQELHRHIGIGLPQTVCHIFGLPQSEYAFARADDDLISHLRPPPLRPAGKCVPSSPFPVPPAAYRPPYSAGSSAPGGASARSYASCGQ